MNDIEKLRANLAQHGQSHLLKFWPDLLDEEKRDLQCDLSEINLSEVESYFKKACSSLNESVKKLDAEMKPLPADQQGSLTESSAEQLEEYRLEGLNRVANGEVGVLLMAGGQGTRLGVTYPKGMYNVGLISKKSLFQIQAERIKKLEQLAQQHMEKNGCITWYIMTSEHTMAPTRAFFEQNDYFGLAEDNVVMFEQGKLPCFDFEGKILLSAKHKVSQSPNGNGGLYKALQDQGVLDDMTRRNIKWLHAHSVDNILIKVADPVFIGYCIKKNADCAAKVVKKCSPTEAIGVVCQVNGQYHVVEYSEITDSTAHLTDNKGQLVFNDGNICNHFFTVKFLQKIADTFEPQLKLHIAKKKIPYIDENGILVKPTVPNGIKIEKFIFDVFQFADTFVTWKVPRNSEFSTLKNADDAGKDCPSTARQDLYALHKSYIEAAGGTVFGDEIEISPLLSYSGEGLSQVKGKHFDSPFLLTSLNEDKSN